MEKEIEAMFADTDHQVIRDKLKKLGGTCLHPMRDMRRALVQTTEMKQNNAFLRVRDEGDKTTLTYKQVNALSLDGVDEAEVIVSDFDTTIAILTASGLAPTTYQESRRETWRVVNSEVMLDEWPWVAPYIEIESTNEENVRDVAEKLGVDWNEARFGGVDTLYAEKYPERTVHSVIAIPSVRFGESIPKEFIGEKS